ncbi:uncharacterized protein [Solanum tuberosum]|uniref:uncharacterized protein n=1 Tax=Solanum tuberosum TaxID=4113 RepID=UPI00073A13F7|nr:PREDICTED: uncharacterized protein LOC107058205 [Solanum tuberosum]
MQNAVADSMFYRIIACKTTKEAMACKIAKGSWDRLKEEYQGSDRKRQMQVLNLKIEFESLNMKEDETISKYADRISLIESKDLSKLSLGELMSALQAQEQRRTLRRDKFTEGAFSVQKQIFGKGKQQFNQKNKDKHDGGNNSGDTGHISKVFKSRAKASGASQAQVAEAADAHEEQFFAVSYFSINESSDSWLLDSGCTHHLCNDAEMFKFLDHTYKSKVKVGNGKAVEVKGKGTMFISTISGIQTIPDVLYTPDMSQNLLSAGQMLENNYSLHFKNCECVVSNPSGVNLFYVKMSNIMFSVDWEKMAEQAYTITSQTCTNQWHKRESKQNCHFQANQVWRANQKLQLIHTDVCGPMKTDSLSETKRNKLDNKAHKSIFMGYSSSKGYMIFCLKSEKLILSREVKFDEAAGWDWKNQKTSYFDLFSKEQPQHLEDELVDDVPVRRTRTLKDVY